MDQGDPNKMTSNATYPSPTAQHTGLPFYSHQPSAERDSHPHTQAPIAPMQGSDVDGRQFSELVQAPLSTPQQLAQQGLNINSATPQGDLDSAKKKQKVSRACDECRRKKIKCDAVEGDTSKPSCSACVRSEIQCQFSRAPQKRGPSKGYIKELAERVQMLEHQTNSPYQPPGGFPTDVNAYSPPDFLGPESRKRTHSMTDGPTAFSSDADQLQNFGKGFTPNMTATNVSLPDGAFAFPGGFNPHRNVNSELDALNIDPIEEYYRALHIHFPILPDSRSELQSLLDSAHKTVKDAILAAIHAAAQIFIGSTDSRVLDTANNLLARLRDQELTDRGNLENLLILQACLFLIISKELEGPGKNVSVLAYGFAYAIATYLNLHLNEESDTQDAREPFGVKSIGRRAWLVLAMLDRWRAASMVTPFTVPDENVWLLPSDRKLLGEPAYDLIRLSLALGHVAETIVPRRPRMHADDGPDLLVARVVKGEIERFREGAELTFPALRHVHLAYLHAKLLADRQLEVKASNTKVIMAGAFAIVNLLPTDQNLASPLTHHFAALAAITLAEVLERDPAPIGNALKDLENALNNGTVQYPYGVNGNRPAWSVAISKFISNRLELQNQKLSGAGATQRDGLQHLADAAVGADGGHPGEETGKKLEGQVIDWTAMTRAGYLRLFE